MSAACCVATRARRTTGSRRCPPGSGSRRVPRAGADRGGSGRRADADHVSVHLVAGQEVVALPVAAFLDLLVGAEARAVEQGAQLAARRGSVAEVRVELATARDE